VTNLLVSEPRISQISKHLDDSRSCRLTTPLSPVRVALRTSARCFTPSSIRRVMMNAAGSMTRMKNHVATLFVNRSVPRVTNRVRCSSSGYTPNCHTHSKPCAA